MEFLRQFGHIAPQFVLAIVLHNDQCRLHLLVLSAADPAAHLLLKQCYNVRNHVVSLSLQLKQCLWRSNENLGVSEFDIILEALLVDQHLDTVFLGIATELGPRVLRYHLVTEQELVITLPMDKSSSSYSNVLQQTQVTDLMCHPHIVKQLRTLDVVRFDTAYIEWFFLQQCGDQLVH